MNFKVNMEKMKNKSDDFKKGYMEALWDISLHIDGLDIENCKESVEWMKYEIDQSYDKIEELLDNGVEPTIIDGEGDGIDD